MIENLCYKKGGLEVFWGIFFFILEEEHKKSLVA